MDTEHIPDINLSYHTYDILLKRFECDKCERILNTATEMKTHLKYCKMEKETKVKWNINSKCYECTNCHIWTDNTPEKVSDHYTYCVKTDLLKSYVRCYECNALFSSVFDRQQHWNRNTCQPNWNQPQQNYIQQIQPPRPHRRFHQIVYNTKCKKYKCSTCLRAFNSFIEWKKHLESCTDFTNACEQIYRELYQLSDNNPQTKENKEMKIHQEQDLSNHTDTIIRKDPKSTPTSRDKNPIPDYHLDPTTENKPVISEPQKTYLSYNPDIPSQTKDNTYNITIKEEPLDQKETQHQRQLSTPLCPLPIPIKQENPTLLTINKEHKRNDDITTQINNPGNKRESADNDTQGKQCSKTSRTNSVAKQHSYINDRMDEKKISSNKTKEQTSDQEPHLAIMETKSHVKSNNKTQPPNNGRKPTTYKFKCEQCPTKFRTNFAKRQHKLWKCQGSTTQSPKLQHKKQNPSNYTKRKQQENKENKPTDRNSKTKQTVKTSFRCKFCTLEFPFRFARKRHMTTRCLFSD